MQNFARIHVPNKVVLSTGIAVFMLTMGVLTLATPVQAQQFPDCVSASSDSDGCLLYTSPSPRDRG